MPIELWMPEESPFQAENSSSFFLLWILRTSFCENHEDLGDKMGLDLIILSAVKGVSRVLLIACECEHTRGLAGFVEAQAAFSLVR